jgi:hypothetical protein
MWPFRRNKERPNSTEREVPVVNPDLVALRNLVDHYLVFGAMTRGGVEQIVSLLLKLGASNYDVMYGLSAADTSIEILPTKTVHGVEIRVIAKWPDVDREERRKGEFAIKRWFDDLRPAEFRASADLVSKSLNYDATLYDVMVCGGLDDAEEYRRRIASSKEVGLFSPKPEDLNAWLAEAQRALKEIGPLLFDKWERTDRAALAVRQKLGI